MPLKEYAIVTKAFLKAITKTLTVVKGFIKVIKSLKALLKAIVKRKRV